MVKHLLGGSILLGCLSSSALAGSQFFQCFGEVSQTPFEWIVQTGFSPMDFHQARLVMDGASQEIERNSQDGLWTFNLDQKTILLFSVDQASLAKNRYRANIWTFDFGGAFIGAWECQHYSMGEWFAKAR